MNEMLLEQNAQYRQNRTSQANLGISGQQMQQQVPVGVPTVAVAQVIFEWENTLTSFFFKDPIGALYHGRPRQNIRANSFLGHRQRLKLWLGRSFDHLR